MDKGYKNRMINTGITAIGTAVPANHYNQMDIVEFIARTLDLSPPEKRRLSSIHKATGIMKRHTVLKDLLKEKGEFHFFPNNQDETLPSTQKRMSIFKETALPLATVAIQNCFDDFEKVHGGDNGGKATFSKQEITHLITVSCTGMYAPGIDIDIIRHFNLPTTTHRICINFMGCYGAFNALKTAEAICKANAKAKVLVVCVELCSLHFQYPKCQDNILSTSIFADGAAAVFVESFPSVSKNGNNNHNHIREGYRNCLILQDFYCDIVPDSHEAMAWSIADSGFDIVLSSFVPSLIKSGINEFFRRFLQKMGHQFEDIQHFAIHPGGLKILEACEQALNITPFANRHSYEIFRNFGNMSSVTILFVLQRYWQDLVQAKKAKVARNSKLTMSSENILCCAFGPGLTLESMLIRTHSV